MEQTHYRAQKLEVPDGEYWWVVVNVDGEIASGHAMNESRALVWAEKLNAAYTRGQQDARSVAHPPTSELVSAGNAMKSQLLYHERYDVDRGHDEAMNLEDIALANAWDAALAAHPKEVAPTVQEIGEQTPVAPIMVRALPYNEAMNQFDATAELEYTDCDRPLIEGWKWTPVHVVPAIPLYRFPMSSEARDLAFEALEDARIVVGNTHLIDQALSALRG